MKRIKTIFFLSVLLLCGVLLRAATTNKGVFKPKEIKNVVHKVEAEKDFEFFPGSILL